MRHERPELNAFYTTQGQYGFAIEKAPMAAVDDYLPRDARFKTLHMWDA
jgi:hypothetical protein